MHVQRMRAHVALRSQFEFKIPFALDKLEQMEGLDTLS